MTVKTLFASEKFLGSSRSLSPHFCMESKVLSPLILFAQILGTISLAWRDSTDILPQLVGPLHSFSFPFPLLLRWRAFLPFPWINSVLFCRGQERDESIPYWNGWGTFWRGKNSRVVACRTSWMVGELAFFSIRGRRDRRWGIGCFRRFFPRPFLKLY